MPLLDAMARGVAVLTSNVSAMPEVAGDAALLVDPADLESISAGLEQLAASEQLRKILVEKGLKRSQEFSWPKAVDQTWKVYRELT